MGVISGTTVSDDGESAEALSVETAISEDSLEFSTSGAAA